MRFPIPLALLALGALPGVARAPETPEPPPAVSSAELWSRPGDRLGGEVRFVVQHAEWLEAWNPMVTRFGAGEYRAWSAWGDDQLLWKSEEYDAPRVVVFVRRGGAAEWALESLARYDRYEVVGRVDAVFAGRPWIEVLGVRPLTEQLGDGSLVHARRGVEAYTARRWTRASDEFERALASPVPPIARAELKRLRGLCLDRLANPTLEELVEREVRAKD